MPDEKRAAIANLSTEDRTFPPPAGFAVSANAQPSVYERSRSRLAGLLGQAGEGADHLVQRANGGARRF